MRTARLASQFHHLFPPEKCHLEQHWTIVVVVFNMQKTELTHPCEVRFVYIYSNDTSVVGLNLGKHNIHHYPKHFEVLKFAI